MKKLTERVSVSAREAVPLRDAPAAKVGMRLGDFDGEAERREHIDQALASTVASVPASVASIPPERGRPAMRPTKMIATPIDATLRKILRDLRNEHEVSEAFILETALREYFGTRPLDEIAADLRRRGGRLRRTT